MRTSGKISLLLVLTILSTSPCHKLTAEETFTKRLLDPSNLSTTEADLYFPKLYDIDTDTLVQVKPDELLPERIYAAYLKEKKSWFFSLTNARGKLSEPAELIQFNTVVPGKYLGAKFVGQRYRLNHKWKWVPTKAIEEYYLWVISKPQNFVRIQILTPLTTE